MKKSPRKIKHTAVLINYCNAKDTLRCLNSIAQTKDTPHVIVVDNGSTDTSVADLKQAYPNLDLIANPVNVGFSLANNLGIERALKMGAQVVYILNNDTEVDSNLFFRSYRSVAGKNRLVGGKIYYAKGYEYHDPQKGLGNVLWYAGGHFDWQSVIAVHDAVDEIDRGQYDKIRPVDFVTGCFMAIPRQVFKKIGLFDPSFFLYLEDADLCLRAKKLGVEIIYNPSLILYHLNSSSTVAGSPLVDYYLTRNRFLIGKRYGGIRIRLALLKEALSRNWSSSVRRRAFFDYLWGRMGNRNDKIPL